MVKATVPVHRSESESNNDLPKSSKKQAVSASKASSRSKEPSDEEDGNEGAQDGDEGSDEPEEEYEIEAILDAKHGTFPNGRVGYLVKWKGYGDDQNSWVDEKDAGNAKVLIDEYWRKTKAKKVARKSDVKPRPSITKGRKSMTKEDSIEVDEATAPKKRGRPPKKTHPSSEQEQDDMDEDEIEIREKKKTRKSSGAVSKRAQSSPDAMDVDEESFIDMKKWKNAASWDHIVESIDTVERTEDGKLYVYFSLKNGKGHAKEESSICKEKMPYMMIEFYEKNLRWKASEGQEA